MSRLVLRGIAASPGIAIGPVVVVDRAHVKVPRRRLEPAEVEPEIRRLHFAINEAVRQLDEVARGLPTGATVALSVIQAHRLMLSDQVLVTATEKAIRDGPTNAEAAVQDTIEELCAVFDRLDDVYLRERRSDFEFVSQRLLRCLTGRAGRPVEKLTAATVVVANDLSPADTAEMLSAPVVGFATNVGSRTSHTAILARSLEIPAVVGLGNVTEVLVGGDIVVVDGLRGEVVIDPEPHEREAYEARGVAWVQREQRLLENRALPAETRDGVRVELLANIEFPGEAAVAIEHGADGVGLYRSEFLYINRDSLPSEEEQYEVFRAVAGTLAPRPVTLRTFDVGGDKYVSPFRLPAVLNPALGLRAIRLGLRLPDVFKTHLRAMLRAAVHGDLRIMFPMVSGVGELRAVLALLREAKDELRARGVEHVERPRVGCMIELPAAVLTADLLAREVDFFSIGTNDLIQYTLAIDRASEQVAHLYHPLHPAVLRAIDWVVRAGRDAGIPVGMCGAMADDPLYALVLVGLGLDNLSMTAVSLPEVKQAIRAGSAAIGRAIVKKAITLATVEEVEALVRRELGEELAAALSPTRT